MTHIIWAIFHPDSHSSLTLNPYAKEKRGKPKPKAKPKPKPSGMVKLEETPTDEPADLDGIQGRKLIHLPDADELKYDHSNSAPPFNIFQESISG